MGHYYYIICCILALASHHLVVLIMDRTIPLHFNPSLVKSLILFEWTMLGCVLKGVWYTFSPGFFTIVEGTILITRTKR